MMTSESVSALTDPVERALKVVLMTDLVNSTALVDGLGDSPSGVVFRAHEELARDLLTNYNGLEIDSSDGFLLVFDRPADAVEYALSYHEALASLSTKLGVELAARIGIHLGEVTLRRNRPEYVARGAKPVEIEGLAKPLTARLMYLAQARQTLLTRPVYEVARRAAVGGALAVADVVWIEHGPYRLKGVTEPTQVCEVGRRGTAPLKPPCGSAKATQDVGLEVGWRPARGLLIPGFDGWRLGQRLGRAGRKELWSVRQEAWGPQKVTLGGDEAAPPPVETAVLFTLASNSTTADERTGDWRLSTSVDCLVVVSGPEQGHYAIRREDILCCGRDPAMHLCIQDPRVSRRHLEIRYAEEGHRIRALQAKNGVFVNGRRIECEEQLQTGDVITIGDTELAFYESVPLSPAPESS